MNSEGLKQRIQQRMDELGWKSAPLAKAAGLSPTYVRDLLRTDEPNPRLRHLQALAEQLQTTIEWLLNGENPGTELSDLMRHRLNKDARQEVLDFAKFKANQK